MRKTVIALILCVPLLFVFVIFSSVNMASLGVNISANGISITNKSSFENETVEINLSDKKKYSLDVAVSPDNATNKDYTFEVEEVEGSALADVYVEPSTGEITALSEGAAKIYAVSNDGGYRDGITVLVSSSKPYDFDFSLFGVSDEVKLNSDKNGYAATVNSGIYTYQVKIKPDGFTDVRVEASDDGSLAEINEGLHEIMLPFSGKVQLKITVPNGVDGDIVKNLSLNVRKPSSRSGIIVNGQADDASALLDSAARSTYFWVEAPSEPQFSCEDERVSVKTVTTIGANRYKVELGLSEGFANGDSFSVAINSKDSQGSVSFTFKDFDFNLLSNLNFNDENGNLSAYIQRKTPTTFYASPVVPSENVTYVWKVTGAAESILSPAEGGKSCVVTAADTGEFTLSVTAWRDGLELGKKEIRLTPINKVNAVNITNDADADLAAVYTVGGKKYENGGLVENKYFINVIAYNIGGDVPEGISDLDYNVSDSKIAELGVENGKIFLTPRGTGEVTVTIEWKGNYTYGTTNARRYLKLNIVKEAVEVSTASQLTEAAEDNIIVLTSDISLGVKDDGTEMSVEERNNLLKEHEMPSTYNTEWYKETGKEAQAVVHYVQEFKHDVYGNGHTIDADKFTHVFDGTGLQPALSNYREPLYFVCYNNVASVAGQDNCAFLVRTDGVKLYGVNLYGCKDSSLYKDGKYDLTNLNRTGTTLEINASVSVVNCRIRNGRNVVRAYGGNREGNKYFIESLQENSGCDGERITVNIKGCVIAQGREFLLKIGANRALRASAALGAEPALFDQGGRPYIAKGQNRSNMYDLLEDEYFYRQYVMTDVTLEDSVLETSGLFTVGVESNFSGKWLYSGSDAQDNYGKLTQEWRKSGGTSFASVLRLEGDVRLYDWKDISLVDSSTLIESPINSLNEWLKLDIHSMFDFVNSTNKDLYGNLIYSDKGANFVHGGIAFYGGGRNYSQISVKGLNPELSDLNCYGINIDILADSPNLNLQRQGTMLPNAAGTNDFRFYLYDSESKNSYQKQLNDAATGAKYSGVSGYLPYEF